MKEGLSSKRSKKCKLKKIVSGGQTGVDRAALDVAIDMGITHGGWCPRGRLAEDGRVPAVYDLQESDSANYADRTKQNIIDSDATLILYQTELSGGTRLTLNFAREVGKPFMAICMDEHPDPADVAEWIQSVKVRCLNVAGPRASGCPRIHSRAKSFLKKVFEICLTPSSPKHS